MNQKRKLILASASPRRSELLAQIGIKFEVMKSTCEEVTDQTKPDDVVYELSRLKAMDVVELLGDTLGEAVVLAADTIVAMDDMVLGKPKSTSHAIEMLQMLQGKKHSVYTGVTICYKKDTALAVETFVEQTTVDVFPMTLQEIESYVALDTCMDKAGAYGIQNEFAAYIRGIEGDYTNVVGLPIGHVYQVLKKI